MEFSNETENMFSVFLSSYRNACGCLGELKKAVETLPAKAHIPTAFLVLPNLQDNLVLSTGLIM